MVTRNWYNYYKSQRMWKVITDGLKYQNGNVGNSGYGTSPQSDTLLFRTGSVQIGGSSNGIVLGSGMTPATLDDYCLESRITSGLSGSVSLTSDPNNDLLYTLVLTSTSTDDITIGEIGIMSYAYTGQNGGNALVLIERTVLDTPVTIPAGGIGQVTYTIRMNYPTA